MIVVDEFDGFVNQIATMIGKPDGTFHALFYLFRSNPCHAVSLYSLSPWMDSSLCNSWH